MLVLPPGAYGSAAATGGVGSGAASASARRECLLTSSLDGTLRLWDVSADLMSLEVCVAGAFCGVWRLHDRSAEDARVAAAARGDGFSHPFFFVCV